ncbi:MAG: hypothetical protein EBS01_05740 [Verrucomicrobia bacterium]|nr:hypothetical protein [Verrucomicrobiota bacterium]
MKKQKEAVPGKDTLPAWQALRYALRGVLQPKVDQEFAVLQNALLILSTIRSPFSTRCPPKML